MEIGAPTIEMIRRGVSSRLSRRNGGLRAIQLTFQYRCNSTNEESLKKLSTTERRLAKTLGNGKRGMGKVKSPWEKLDRSDSSLKRPNDPNRRGVSQDVIPQLKSDVSGNDSGGNIDRLRNAFMQSFNAHRERGQTNSFQKQQEKQRPNSPDRSNTESRLDQLLRLSKMKSNERRVNPFRDRSNFNNQNRENRASRKTIPVTSEANVLQQELMRENTLSKNQNKQTNTLESSNKKLLIPNRPISILQLSSLTRESKEKILEILNVIGERPPRNESLDDYKVDIDIAELVALELGFDPEREKRSKCSAEDAEKRMLRQGADATYFDEEAYENLPPRPAVVCICGHVDHGTYFLIVEIVKNLSFMTLIGASLLQVRRLSWMLCGEKLLVVHRSHKVKARKKTKRERKNEMVIHFKLLLAQKLVESLKLCLPFRYACQMY